MSGKSVAMMRVWVGAGVFGAVLLSGCQPSGGATTPPPSISPFLPTVQTASPTSASPSATVTPTLSPSPTLVVTARPTTPEETAALAAEAERVYREHQRLVDEYESKGGAASLPEPLKAYVGDIFATAIEQTLQSTYREGRRVEGRTQVTQVSVFTTDLEPKSLLGIQFCNDRTSLVHVAKDGKRIALTSRVMNRAEFSRGPDGKLRITHNFAQGVATCDV